MTGANTIYVNCYNCGADNNEFYASENGFTIVKCLECGLLYVTPRPTLAEIAKAYECGVHQGSTKLKVTGRFARELISGYCRVMKDFYGTELSHQKSTWLDIGCGYGEFIHALQRVSKNNVIARGVEPNIHKQKSARKRGLDVSYFDLGICTEQYDFISLLNVYSHLPNPKKSLMDWKRLLKPRGELLLETGDAATLDSTDIPRPLYLPDHLSFASEDIVVNILKKSGFEVIDIRKYCSPKHSATSVVKETLKLFLPNRKSTIKVLLKGYKRDMYVRAKLKNQERI